MVPRETWTDQRLDELKKDMDHRFDSVDQRFDAVDQRFDAIDQRFEAVDQRFEAVDQRFNMVEARMAEGFTRLDSDIRELRKMMFYGFVSLMTVMVSGFAGTIAL